MELIGEILGVNTGFGGSANTYTNDVKQLQRNLVSFLNCGILREKVKPAGDQMTNGDGTHGSFSKSLDQSRFAQALPNEDALAASTMPECWVRATLLIRSNSLARGNSGVRPELVDSLVHLLRYNLTPVIPLRGSISASGDLIPLSYVAGTLQGSNGVEVWVDDAHKESGRQRVPADVALSNSSLPALQLGPKEGLAIFNGTAVSAGVGALALHDAHLLVSLSQILTAMGVESLRGSPESFDEFFSICRPHPGQAEVSRNIRRFLRGSLLISDKEADHASTGSLRQDRYSIRTTPQWIGPQLENLMLADKQIEVEINSTTDNPIVDVDGQRVLHGGNFQAMSVTSATEKIRSSLQTIGRMLFAQCTELINPALNNGLAPNLTADEPSQSYLLKGVDISVAALQAELGFLAASVEPHVQNAEMGNQSLNSLALLSARYTHTALGVLSQISAAYLLTLCQALDLRALDRRFLAAFKPFFFSTTQELFSPVLSNTEVLHESLWSSFQRAYYSTTTIDSYDRFPQILQTLQPTIIAHACANAMSEIGGLSALHTWTSRCVDDALYHFRSIRIAYAKDPNASGILGSASKRMYQYVRFELGIPFQISTPKEVSNGVHDCFGAGERDVTIGKWIGKIHGAIQNGALFVPAMECLREAEAA